MSGELALNDPRVDAALKAHWNGAPCGAKRRRRMRDALMAAGLRPVPPGAYSVFSNDTIRAIQNSCSTPASRAEIPCVCRHSGKPLDVCKDQPQCNLKAAP